MVSFPPSLVHLSEPLLAFGHGEECDDPKSGLFLYGPVTDAHTPRDMRVGVIATRRGIELYQDWIKRANGFIPAAESPSRRQIPFPGFGAAFGVSWRSDSSVQIPLDERELYKRARIRNKFERTYKTVSYFVEALQNFRVDEGVQLDLWFVVVPDDVYLYCRPSSSVPSAEAVQSSVPISIKFGRQILAGQPSLFPEETEAAKVLQYHTDFHHQLKARLLNEKITIQIVRESSLIPRATLLRDRVHRNLQDEASLAWNLSTTAFFKCDGKPWKLANIRKGVCYLGLVFKKYPIFSMDGNACCGAQMFLDSGDGQVFKGARGDYYHEGTRQFHLTARHAEEILSLALRGYHDKCGTYPAEVFIHGRTYFNDEEWSGFASACPSGTNLVGVRIRPTNQLKLFPEGDLPVMRGIAYIRSPKSAYLWTRGFIPRLGTYPGRETPNPLSVDVVKGDANIDQVLRDVLALTKLNYNACIYSDGLPVTLRFADAVGEILTAADIKNFDRPMPFKYYI